MIQTCVLVISELIVVYSVIHHTHINILWVKVHDI